MTDSHISPQQAASHLLSRRKARASLTEFCRFVAPHEPPAAHHKVLCDALDAVADGNIQRLMVFMPPGSAKTTYATIRFPAYYVGKYPNKGVICASYSGDLATMFGGKVRDLVKASEFRELFPVTLTEDTRAKGEWTTDAGGFYYATGVGGSVTGRRGDILILDDPIKGRADADSALVREKAWEWFKADLRTRGKPGYAVIMVMTRWHEDDPAGRILPDNWAGESGTFTDKFGEKWTVLCLPAEARDGDLMGRKVGEYLWTDYKPAEEWEREKRFQGPRNWLSLYQQVPSAEEGLNFRREWFRYYDALPKDLNVYMSGDFAVTEGAGDFTELAVWGVDPQGRIYALDWWSKQATSDVWVDALLDLADHWKPMWFVGEMGPIRRAVEPLLALKSRERKVFVATQWLAHEGNKEAHSVNFQGLCSAGYVYWPKFDWAERVINQLLKFPAGRHDDAVDACSLFGRFVHKTWQAAPTKEPVKVDFSRLPTIGEMMTPIRRDEAAL